MEIFCLLGISKIIFAVTPSSVNRVFFVLIIVASRHTVFDNSSQLSLCVMCILITVKPLMELVTIVPSSPSTIVQNTAPPKGLFSVITPLAEK